MFATVRHKLTDFRANQWRQGFLASILAVCTSQVVAEKPKIVSIDFCADQYALALADLSRIQAVSYEAVGPRSFYGERAVGMPTVSGSVEELIQMQPGLVMRTWRGGPRAAKILKEVGIPLYTPPFMLSLEQGFDLLQGAAEAIGEEENAAKLIRDYQVRWQKLKEAQKSLSKGAYMTPSGVTAGTGTYVNDIIKLAGFDTIAESAEISGWITLPLEKLAINPPDFVVASFFGDPDVHVSHWSSGRHGVYKKLMGDLPVIHVPSRFLSCSGAFAVDAAEFIRAEAVKLGLFEGEAID